MLLSSFSHSSENKIINCASYVNPEALSEGSELE